MMSRKGCYRYVCEDCGEKVWVNRSDRQTRFGLFCPVCGGRHLTPTPGSIAREREMLSHEAHQTQTEEWMKKRGWDGAMPSP